MVEGIGIAGMANTLLGQVFTFFSKPNIKFDDKLKKDKTIMQLKINGVDKRQFKMNIWKLTITNKKRNKLFSKFSKNATSCYIGLNIIKDKQPKNKHELILRWMNNDSDIPIESIDIPDPYNQSKENDYNKLFVDNFVSRIEWTDGHTVDLPVNTERNIIFIFTIEEISSIYIVYQVINKSELYESQVFQLPFDKWNIELISHSNQYNDWKGTLYELEIHRWDNIEFKRIVI